MRKIEISNLIIVNEEPVKQLCWTMKVSLGDVVTTDRFTDSIVDATYQRNSRTQEKSVKKRNQESLMA